MPHLHIFKCTHAFRFSSCHCLFQNLNIEYAFRPLLSLKIDLQSALCLLISTAPPYHSLFQHETKIFNYLFLI